MAVLIVVSSWSELGNTGMKTGWYLPEVAHPYQVFKKHGIPVTICSPKGGATPMDPKSLEDYKEDPECKAFLEDSDAMNRVNNSIHIKDIDASKFKVIFFAGGHGPMWDFPDDELLNKAATVIYENGGIASAVCHGTVGLLNTKLSNGSYLIKGHDITCFTNSEEISINLMEAVPFPLETKLIEHGAKFHDGGDWQNNVQVSGRVITGQNPMSASAMAEAIVQKVKEL